MFRSSKVNPEGNEVEYSESHLNSEVLTVKVINQMNAALEKVRSEIISQMQNW